VKVLILRADAGGCAFYRVQEPARVISEQFPEIDIEVTTEIAVQADLDPNTRLTKVSEVETDADVIVVQRPLKQGLGAMLEQARRQGIATVVELDDDFSTISRNNRAYPMVQPGRSPLDNKEWLAQAADAADLLTCTTEELSKYNERYVVLPNYVPASILDIKRPERDRPVVGWTGTLQVHPDDLQVTRGQIGKVMADAKADFFVVGDGAGVQDALKLRTDTKTSASGWVPLENYYQTIADNIDIGIVPLERSDFNNAKSWLKGLEFAALGIPFVATSTADYQRLADLGVGHLAHDHNGFRYALRNWLNEPWTARIDGESYRDVVREHLTYELHAKDWVRAWELAIDTRKKASK
jgi:hypothetical protein